MSTKKRINEAFDTSTFSSKKPRLASLDKTHSVNSPNRKTVGENAPTALAQFQPTKAPRPHRRRLNNKKYKTPTTIEAIKGLHENPTDPRYLPIFQAKPGYKNKLLAKGRGAVKPEDYAGVVADNFLSSLSKGEKRESVEPPSYPATPVFGFAPPTTSIITSQTSAFITIVPSINAAREKVNFNLAPPKRTLPNAFEAPPRSKSIPIAKVDNSVGGNANVICTDLTPYKLILQTPVMKIARPLDAEALTPLSPTLFLPSMELNSIDEVGVDINLPSVAKVKLNKTFSSSTLAKGTPPIVEDSAPEVSEVPKAKRKVVSLQEYRQRQQSSKATTSKSVSVTVLEDADCESEEAVKTDSEDRKGDAPAQPKLSFKIKSLPPRSNEVPNHKRNPFALSASKSRSNALKRGATNLDGSSEMRFGTSAKQQKVFPQTVQNSVPMEKPNRVTMSNPAQAASKNDIQHSVGEYADVIAHFNTSQAGSKAAVQPSEPKKVSSNLFYSGPLRGGVNIVLEKVELPKSAKTNFGDMMLGTTNSQPNSSTFNSDAKDTQPKKPCSNIFCHGNCSTCKSGFTQPKQAFSSPFYSGPPRGTLVYGDIEPPQPSIATSNSFTIRDQPKKTCLGLFCPCQRNSSFSCEVCTPSQPTQTPPQSTSRNPLEPISGNQEGPKVSEQEPKYAKVEATFAPAFTKMPQKVVEAKVKEQIQFNDPETFQPRKIRNPTQTPQAAIPKPVEYSKSELTVAEEKPKVEAVVSAATIVASPLAEDPKLGQQTSTPATQTAKTQALLTTPTPQPSNVPAASQTLILLTKLVQLSNPPQKTHQTQVQVQAPPPHLSTYKFGALLPMLPRLLGKRLEEVNLGLPRKRVRVEDVEEDSDEDVGYLEKLERSLQTE